MRGMQKVEIELHPPGKESSKQHSNAKAVKMPPLTELRPNDKCHCCPYGYHIDLDFVRYCEALANGTYLRQLKQLKRNRRRQRKSMEALLNNHDPSSEDGFSRSKMIDSACGPPPDLVNTSEALRDALKEAMLDFEDALQKSETSRSEHKKKHCSSSSPNVPSIDLLNSTSVCFPSSRDTPHLTRENEAKLQPTQLFSPADSFPSFSGSRSRSGSASSLTSTSTVSSYTDHNGATLPTLPSQQIADTMDTLNNSVLLFSRHLSGGQSGTTPDSPSGTVVSMNNEALHSIREQMAASLQRMRELEEHVKSIPILQVKLSVLKEEKRLLMLQLKAKASKLDHRSVGVGMSPSHSSFDMSIDEMGRRLDQLGAMGITSPRPRRKMLSESRIRSRSESPVFRNKSPLIDLTDFHSHKRAHPNGSVSPEDEICSLLEQVPKTDLYLRETRSIGINCAVLTRDIGTSHVLPPSKSVATHSILKTDEPSVCKECSKGKIDKTERKARVVCLKCFEREQKLFDDASVGTNLSPPKKDHLVLSVTPCHMESFPPAPCPECLERCTKQMKSLAVSTSDLKNVTEEESKKLDKHLVNNSVNTECIYLKNASANTEKVRTNNLSMNTDLYMDDVINREEYETMVTLTAPLHLNPEVVEKASQTKIDQLVSSAQVVLEDFDLKAVPAQSKVTTRTFGTVTKNERMVDRGIGFNSVNDVICDHCQKLSKRSIGIGDSSVADILCHKCLNKHYRSVACGDHKVSKVICDKCSGIKQRTIGCGLATISDSFCQRCDNLKTVSVGVGNASVNQLLCLSCLQKKNKNVSIATTQHPQTKSVETNTNESQTSKRLLPKTSMENGSVSICDKCSSTIHSVATDFVQKAPPSFSNPPPPLPSRIPRLTIPTTDIISTVNTGSSANSSINTKSKIAVSSSKTVSSRTKTVQLKNENNRSLPEYGGDVYVNKGFEKFLLMKDSSKTHKSANYETKTHLADEFDSSDSSDSESSDSPDEGSYDGVYGNIVNTCHDDEAIRQGLPGASMFQPIQDKKPNPINSLNEELLRACQILNVHLNKSNQPLTKEINASFNTIQQEWFRVSSQKDASSHLVEEYMDAFEDMSPNLLDKVVNMNDANGNTAMHYAVSHGNFDVVSLLLDSKVCDVNKQNKAGYTCIMLASLAQLCEPSDRCVLQRLFKLGDVNIKASQHGQTALMLAVSHGRLDIVKMLLEAGAAVNIQDEDGSTALMCAGEHGHTEIVRLLLNHPDCDPTLKDNDNCTALAIAMEAGHKDIGVLIYAHTSLSRGSSPHSSTRGKRRNVIPSSSTPPPRTPPPPSPALSRKSTMSVP